jgi:hypothetical protein
MARQTATEATHPFSKYLGSAPGERSETSIKLEEVVAKLTDSVNLQAQYNKQVDQRLANLQSFLSQPKATNHGSGSVPQSFARPPPAHNWQGSTLGTCFYCRGDVPHRIPDCQHANMHLDLGWIKKDQGQLRLPDGQRIPRDGNKSMKEVIESLNKKPGIIPMAKIQDKTAFFQDTAPIHRAHQTQNTDEDSMIMELIQQVGAEKIQQLLQASEYTCEAEDDWEQNFC